MVKKLLYCIVLFCVCNAAFAGDTLRVLFIGNSYTDVNNLPQVVSKLASAGGDSLFYEMSVPGGQTLEQHCSNTATLAYIAQGNWDFVVLQEQSQRPSFEEAQVAAEVYPYAKYLDSLVHHYNTCAQTVFYMTWGRKNGDVGNCAFWPPVCTYQGMDSLLQLRYSIMAEANRSWISPVARLWRNLRNNNPAINLYQADESHPSDPGTYAAAISFYSLLFGKDPVPNTYNFTLSAADANAIKTAGKAVVFDSLHHWRTFTTLPVVESIALVAGGSGSLTVECSAVNPQNIIGFSWNFGDGSPNSFAASPTHTYASPGSYTVCLTVSSPLCDAKTYCQTIVIAPVNIKDVAAWKGLSIYPNPVKNKLFIRGAEPGTTFRLFNYLGAKVEQGVLVPNEAVADMETMAAGIYFLDLRNKQGQRKVVKIVKE